MTPKCPRRIFSLLLLLALLLLAGGVFYVSDYYHADPSVSALLAEDLPEISITAENGRIVFRPEEVKAGLIFYPGGKVEYTAYSPLMLELAERGFLCILLKMPLNLAFLGMNAADTVYADFPEVGHWILAGHSLGGAAAGIYAAEHADNLDGLMLLAAYTTADLKEKDIKVLSIYGSEDGVLNRGSYEKNRGNLPADTIERIIPGGCHAWFGSYGAQKGDGFPTISNEEQIRLTAETASDCFLN